MWKYKCENYKNAITPYKNVSSKFVKQYTINHEFIKKYNSIKEASIVTKINRHSIGCVCNGKKDIAGDFIWKYAES